MSKALAAALALGLTATFASTAGAAEINGEEYNVNQPLTATSQACTSDDVLVDVGVPYALSETDLAADNATNRSDAADAFQSNFTENFQNAVNGLNAQQFMSPQGFNAAAGAVQNSAQQVENEQGVSVVYGSPTILNVRQGCTI